MIYSSLNKQNHTYIESVNPALHADINLVRIREIVSNMPVERSPPPAMTGSPKPPPRRSPRDNVKLPAKPHDQSGVPKKHAPATKQTKLTDKYTKTPLSTSAKRTAQEAISPPHSQDPLKLHIGSSSPPLNMLPSIGQPTLAKIDTDLTSKKVTFDIDCEM